MKAVRLIVKQTRFGDIVVKHADNLPSEEVIETVLGLLDDCEATTTGAVEWDEHSSNEVEYEKACPAEHYPTAGRVEYFEPEDGSAAQFNFELEENTPQRNGSRQAVSPFSAEHVTTNPQGDGKVKYDANR